MRLYPQLCVKRVLGAQRSVWRIASIGVLAPCLLISAQVSAQAQTTASAASTAVADQEAADKLFQEGRFLVNEEEPEKHIPSEAERNQHPVDFGHFLIALSDRAEAAFGRGDYETAAKYFRAVVAAVPDRSAGFTKLCSTYEAAGQRDKAEAACGAALLREGATVNDYAHYVRLVIGQKEPLNEKQIKHVDDVVVHLQKQFPDQTIGAELECQLGLRLKDEKRLERCTSVLEKQNPDAMQTISFSWILAVMRHDRKAAFNLLERAKQTGATPDSLKWMEAATRALRSPIEQLFHRARLPLGIGLAVALLIAAVAYQRRRLQGTHNGTLRKSNA